MHQIERGIFYENAYLGVTLGGLVYSHGTLLIDAPLRSEDARSWRSALMNQRGGSNRLLISLDAHPDRTLGIRTMDTTILTHQKTALTFRNRPTIFKGQTAESGSIWESYTDAIGMRWANADITFTERISLHWGGPEILLEHHPGPAPGAIWVIIPDEQVVFVGDAVVVDQPPFLANADLEAWQETLALLARSYSDYVIVSGRGGPTVAGAVRDLADFLEDVLAEMEKLAEDNAPPEEVYDLVPVLLKKVDYPEGMQETYSNRLSYGLYQYYLRRYQSIETEEEIEEESEEE